MSFRPRLILFTTVVGILAFLIARYTAQNDEQKSVRKLQGRNNTVLFLSNCEPGLANVLMATSHALAVDHTDIEVHYSSFPKLSKNIKSVSDFATRVSKDVRPISFHSLNGISYGDAISKCLPGGIDNIIQRPGVEGISHLCRNIQDMVMPWSAQEYLDIYHAVLRILDEVDPSAVAVDAMFGPGLDAVRSQGRQYALISPNAIKDNFADRQPWGAILWKYPATSSGYDYPVPLHLIPANVYLLMRFLFAIIVAPASTAKRNFLKANGIRRPSDLFNIYQPDVPWITQSIPESDYPLTVIPSNVISVGPIYLSTAPAADQDPDLAEWLGKAPTVLINLGSSVIYNEMMGTEMAKALKVVLETSDVQILWKFNKDKSNWNESETEPFRNLEEDMVSGRLRLEKWIPIDPAAMLETGNIVLSVHHGGANCYNEAVGTGIPQLILPLWVDLYDYAVRAEYRGIGVWGNKLTAPGWTAEGLTAAFGRVLGDGPEAVAIRNRAVDLGKVAQAKGVGRINAAYEMAKLARHAPEEII